MTAPNKRDEHKAAANGGKGSLPWALFVRATQY